jgi:uncharacterized OB-fold protein
MTASPMPLEILRMPGTRAYPPRESTFTQPFWQALGEGRLQTSCCRACAQLAFPPRPICPHCWALEPGWSALDKRGHLYSWTRIHAAPLAFAAETPYAVGIVDLRLGIRLACRLIDRPLAPAVGAEVELLALVYEDGPLLGARVVAPPPEPA